MRIAVVAAPYPLQEIPSPPLGITYVAAAFAAAGAEVAIFDYVVSSYSRGNLERRLAEFRPDAVGIGSVTMNFHEAVRILSDIKAVNPEILTVMGGPHVTFTAEDTLRRYKDVDLIITGEAEETISEITPHLKNSGKWKEIPGITYREDGKIVINGRRNFIADVDLIPFPARHLLPVSRYRALGFPVSMITGRGCPHACIFCLGRRMVGAKIRRRRIENVLTEMKKITEMGFDRINIADDLFASDKERVKAICGGIKRSGLKFSWSAFARVDTVDQEMLDCMAGAGCDTVSFGVETGNLEMLKRIKKKINTDEVRKAVIMCRKAGLRAHASFIVGLPGETRETLEETDNFAKSLNVFYGYHFLAPFPGTTIREKIRQYDLEILTDDWEKYDANDAIVRTKALRPEDMREFVGRYDREIEKEWQNMLNGYRNRTNTPENDLRVEGHFRLQLSHKILKDDLIEKHGFIERDGISCSREKSAAELCRRITAATDMDENVIGKTLQNFIERGYLRVEDSGNGFTYSWA